MGAFGEKLRKQREQHGIGLDAISNTTKISTRMLRALEDEHFDQLPGGVFNKGFVRAYARQVGLNEEEAVADYLAAVRESQVRENQSRENQLARIKSRHTPAHRIVPKMILPAIIAATTPAASFSPRIGASSVVVTKIVATKIAETKIVAMKKVSRDEAPRHQDLSSSTAISNAARSLAGRFRQKYPAGNPERSDSSPNYDPAAEIPWGKLAVALLLVTLTLALWNSRRHREPTSAPLPALASNQAPAAAPVSAPPARPSQPPRTATPLKAKTSPTGITSSAKPSSAIISTESAATSATAAPANSSSANPTAEEVTAAAPAAPANTFSVLIRADETSWVSITADGKPVAHETLIAPAHTSVRANGQVVVKAGNAAGISFELNGKEIPAQGSEGEVKTYVFDAAGFRVLPPTPAQTTAR